MLHYLLKTFNDLIKIIIYMVFIIINTIILHYIIKIVILIFIKLTINYEC